MISVMIYQSNKMIHWEGCVIYKGNLCFTSFHTCKAKVTKIMWRQKNAFESF